MPTTSELPAIDALSKLDMFAVTKKSEMKSYSVTAQDMANFVKNLSNGGFRGSTTKSLDEFTIYDIGMWWWVNGTTNPTGLTSGVVEIISAAGPDEDNIEATYIQRLSFGEKVYQRMIINGRPSGWGSLTNHNGATVLYDVSSATHISFPEGLFTATPSVVAVPKNSTNNKVYMINVDNVSPTGFDVKKWYSSTDEVVTEVTEITDGTRTTTRTVTVQGAWTQDDSAPFYWIAISDVGG